jgi:ribonuclease HI
MEFGYNPSAPDPLMPEQREPATLLAIYFDGGAKPTNPGPIYGSYHVKSGGKVVLRDQNFDLGHGTNNEAEFKSLEKAICDTLRDFIRGGLDPRRYTVHIFTDSTVLRDRINGKTKRMKSEAEKRMADCAHRVVSLLGNFASFMCTWHDRSNNMARFGH